MNIAIRCDSSFQIGTGHTLRCITLGRLFADLGYKIHFFIRPETGSLKPTELWNESQTHEIPVELSLAEEPQFLKAKFKEIQNFTLLIVDHYAIDSQWESQFAGSLKIMVIDDLANRSHRCNILLDSNFRNSYDGLYVGLVPPNCKMLLGPQNCFLRDEFLRERKKTQPRTQFKNAIAFFGGTDPTNETARFIKALNNLTSDLTLNSKSKLNWKIISTKAHSNLEMIQNLASQSKLSLLINPPHVAEIFRNADVYFGSGGTVTWERMYLGLTGYIVAVADNQIKMAEELESAGYQKFLGRAQDVDYLVALKAFEDACTQEQTLKEQSRKIMEIVAPVSKDKIKSIMEF